jgi:hypothetical protein
LVWQISAGIWPVYRTKYRYPPIFFAYREKNLGGGELGLGVNMRGGILAIRHCSSIKKLLSILLLREEKSGARTPDVDAKEKVQCAQVFSLNSQ